MDVVQRTVGRLGGRVDVDSGPGKGSRVTFQLPLTLAIIEGMVIAVGDQRYILPLTTILRMIRPRKDELFTVMGSSATRIA